MKYIKLAAATAFVLGIAAAGSASADNGLITFTGSVTDGTCVVSGGAGTNQGQGNFTVALDPIGAADLANAGAVGGRKNFHVVFSDGTGGPCAAALTTAKFRFTPSPNVNTNGRLNNIAGVNGRAENVELQLLDGATAIDLTSHAAKDIALDPAAPTTAEFGVQYYATAAATAGGVLSDVIYEATYE